MKPRDTFSANLREARKAAGLSQERLGQLADMHMTEVSRLERGVRDPRLDTITRLAVALKTDVAHLVRNIP